MIEGLKFAAVDIGSNAVRLLLASVFEMESGPYFRKISLIRMPIRLGMDVFTDHSIGPQRAEKLVQTLVGFKHLIMAYGPAAYRACATSAMREARNRKQVCNQIRQRAGIEVEVIDGQEEARIIFSNSRTDATEGQDAQIFVDVGGGSTEITLCVGERRISQSFNIGTIRLLQDMVTTLDWNQMKDWVQAQTRFYKKITAAGSGGNIHKLLRLAKSKDGQSVCTAKIKRIRTRLEAYTVAERITRLGLKPDRADVILPAIRIYLSVLNWAKITSIRVPQMGLADGIIRRLYEQHKLERAPGFTR
jgi:exopolyphosphatase / guanosine-5'-triphosphate,3'-diphosphate pyrophosphatase